MTKYYKRNSSMDVPQGGSPCVEKAARLSKNPVRISSAIFENACCPSMQAPIFQNQVIFDGLITHARGVSRFIRPVEIGPGRNGTLREEKPYVHRLPYCEHTCYAQNGRTSVWL
jgi:hypothetical protein